ncbi:3-ketoacyl-CoA thiolase [Lanmaoa asiatica]|nr:3-ketoacyl-CoA thiolase [Lanmaoa asiatica]
MQRLKQISSHLYSPSGVAALQEKHPDDVVITMAIRSPSTKANKGALKDTPQLTSGHVSKPPQQAIAHSHVDPASVSDICFGSILTPDPVYHVRAAALAAGFPESVPIQVVQRFCGSGLLAVAAVANQIRLGEIEVGLAMGFESLSQSPDNGPPPLSENVGANASARDSLRRMGWTGENVAQGYNISCEDMDEFAALSFQRAEHAQKSGYFDDEIVPLTVSLTKDDEIRENDEWESGSGHGRCGGGHVDDARRKAEALGLAILGKYISTAVTGVPPRVMGIGPVFAVPKVLKNTGLDVEDVDLWEVNEAFASQYIYCVRELGLDLEKVNVNGGAIALGHPLDEFLFCFVLDSPG